MKITITSEDKREISATISDGSTCDEVIMLVANLLQTYGFGIQNIEEEMIAFGKDNRNERMQDFEEKLQNNFSNK